jgi:hypothetical protein
MRLYAGCVMNTDTSGVRPSVSYGEFQRLAFLAGSGVVIG